jgi:hypothetical protein
MRGIMSLGDGTTNELTASFPSLSFHESFVMRYTLALDFSYALSLKRIPVPSTGRMAATYSVNLVYVMVFHVESMADQTYDPTIPSK